MIAYGLQLYSGRRPRQKRIMSFSPAFTPSWSDVERYKRLRSLGKDLNHRMVQTIPRETTYAVGEAIGILHKGVLVFQTEDMSGVLMDCCLYDWPLAGKSCVQRYAETHTLMPSSDEHELLQAYLRAEYRILVPKALWRGAGVYFTDAFSEDQFFVMDVGLSQSPLNPKVAWASRIIPLGAYWMTGGVGLPMTTEARQIAYRRLAAEGVLEDGTITDRRRMALVTVRTCLETEAAEHVAYEDPGGRARDNTAGHAPRRSIPAPGRNDPCSCGSGKKYKKCCGAATTR
jgi:SEC-C motif-containing protein